MSVLILFQAPCKSLMSGIFPDDWKCARVTTLLSRASYLNNYRPISVISVVAKAFERIVYDQLYNFLNSEKSISKQQSGFRSLHSTVTAHLEATDQIKYRLWLRQCRSVSRLKGTVSRYCACTKL